MLTMVSSATLWCMPVSSVQPSKSERRTCTLTVRELKILRELHIPVTSCGRSLNIVDIYDELIEALKEIPKGRAKVLVEELFGKGSSLGFEWLKGEDGPVGA